MKKNEVQINRTAPPQSATTFERMWSGENGDFIARCDFHREKCEYHVTVFHTPTMKNRTDSFKMTCWTPPIFNLMETYDCRWSEDMAEELAKDLEKEIL